MTKSSDLILEDDRLQSLDTIPTALRRANPNMTREFYLRHRSQASMTFIHTLMTEIIGEDLCLRIPYFRGIASTSTLYDGAECEL
jgi:hypothetical protein